MATNRNGVDSSANELNVLGSNFKETIYVYADRDVILYALSIGVSVAQPDALKYLYESDQGFATFPTFPLIPAMAVITDAVLTGNFNGLHVDPARIVLGEQYLKIFCPTPSSGKVVSKGYIAEVLVKSPSGLAIATDIDTVDAKTGRKLAFTQSVIFARDNSLQNRFSNRSSGKIYAVQRAPNRTPDLSIEERTSSDLSALYRIAGVRDTNPLHIDPCFARRAGFQTPILHGVCLLGVAARHALASFGDNDPERFRAVKVRFSSPVFLGDTLRIDMWKEAATEAADEKEEKSLTRIHLEMTNVTTGRISVTGSYVDLLHQNTNRC